MHCLYGLWQGVIPTSTRLEDEYEESLLPKSVQMPHTHIHKECYDGLFLVTSSGAPFFAGHLERSEV